MGNNKTFNRGTDTGKYRDKLKSPWGNRPIVKVELH
jgi:hypothetical protein